MDSVTNSFTSRLGNVPSHKSVGKNGTFWLPPASKDSFSSKLKTFDKKNISSENSPKLAKSNAAKSSTKQSSSLSNPKGVQNTANKASSQSNTNRLLSSKPSHSGSQIKPTLVNSTRTPQQTVYSSLQGKGDVPLLHKLGLNRFSEKKSGEQLEGNLREKENHLQVGDKEEDSSRQKNGKHGTKNAHMNLSMALFENIDNFVSRVVTSAKSENRFTNRSLRVLEHIAREVVSKLSYMDKNDRKVVRMAIDLPNGSPLSIRIEQKSSELSLSFISDDSDSVEVLEYIREMFSGDRGESPVPSIAINLFKSYKEMDSHFKKAA